MAAVLQDRKFLRMKFEKLWISLGFAFVGLVIYLSLTPEPIDVGRIDGVETGHFVAYGWLVLWFSQIYRSMRARVAVAIGFALMGVALEYAQGMTGYRTFEYLDMRDNTFGVGIGFALGWTSLGNVLRAIEAKVGRNAWRQ